MIVKGTHLHGSGRAVVMVTLTVDEALHVGMELGEDGRRIFDAAWDLLPDDAPERAILAEMQDREIQSLANNRAPGDGFPYDNTPP